MEYGLIGEHLGHSFSKEIHEMLGGYQYELKEIQPCDVESFMRRREFKAINVTIPYKQTVMAFLDEIDEKAKAIGAVNTIVNNNGRLIGYNSDYDGILYLLKRNGINAEGVNVLLLGTGGTSHTAEAVFDDLGAKRITKVSRTKKEMAISYKDALALKDTDLIFNCTPCGMFPANDGCPISIESFDNLKAVFDAIYNPLKTRLVLQGISRGIIADGGLYMLVAQAAVACEKFIGKRINQRQIEEVFNYLYRKKRNIVLIGMPGSGKTTLGKLLGKENFIDSDFELSKRIGSIDSFIINNGEHLFRNEESAVIREIAKLSGKVIATGGGAVLRSENIENLKQNGIVVYLKRDLDKLQIGNNRPLSSDYESLCKRFEERKDIYMKSADIVVENNGSIEDCLKELMKL